MAIHYCVWVTQKIELSGYKVNSGYKVSIRAVDPGLRLGRLYEAVDSFEDAVGHTGLKPPEQAIPVPF